MHRPDVAAALLAAGGTLTDATAGMLVVLRLPH